jgi:pilus assembly protein CpaE
MGRNAEGEPDISESTDNDDRYPIVLVESPESDLWTLRQRLSTQPDMDLVAYAVSSEGALLAGGQLGPRRRSPVVIVDLALSGPHDAYSFLSQMRRRFPAFTILAVGTGSDGDERRRALAAGADAFLDPNDSEEIIGIVRGLADRAAGETAAEPPSPVVAPERSGPGGFVISVFSTKGGSGKSFLAANLAVALASRMGQPVSLTHLDVGLADVLSYFGLEAQHSLEELISVGGLTDREAIIDAGIEVAPGVRGYAANSDPRAVFDARSAANLVEALRSAFAYTVVDHPQRYADRSLEVLERSDSVCLIAGLDLLEVRHLSLALTTLMSLGVSAQQVRVVMNRADSKVGIRMPEVERALHMPADGAIPSSRLVPLSLNTGRPICIANPTSRVAESIFGLADRLLQMHPTTGRVATQA